MASVSQFGLKSTDIEEWIPWGGIVHPNVVRQKDGSLFGIIQYEVYDDDIEERIDVHELRRGWSIWMEHQHDASTDTDQEFIVLCWNPWYSSSRLAVENDIGPRKISKNHTVEYFAVILQGFLAEIQKVTEAKLLEYQKIIDFLSFSISIGQEHIEMPEVPLYLDALLSQDLDFKFGGNSIAINDHRIVTLTLPEMIDPSQMFSYVRKINYRYVRRLLCFNDREAKHDFYSYVRNWCPDRKLIKRLELDGVLGNLNGYYQENFFFLVHQRDYKDFLVFLKDRLRDMKTIYIIESFNLKEVFWGSLPGLFLANAKPPIIGFDSLDEILLRRHIEHREVRRRFDDSINRFDEEGNFIEGDLSDKPIKRLSALSDADIKDGIKGDLKRQSSGYNELSQIHVDNPAPPPMDGGTPQA